MKILKKGFTLAELLLVIAIIGIVSAMGAVITKKTTDKAYDMYYYTGYVNLANALTEAEMNGKTSSISFDNFSYENDLVKYLAEIFTGDENNFDRGSGSYTTVEAKNGILYQLWHPTITGGAATIVMGVPAPKTRSNTNNLVTNNRPYKLSAFYYLTANDKYKGMLIPRSEAGFFNVGLETNLLNRKDLLPVYIDDGLKGRMRTDLQTSDSALTKRAYYSFREAFCRMNGGNYTTNVIDGSSKLLVDCTGIALPAEPEIGVLKFADPRKAR